MVPTKKENLKKENKTKVEAVLFQQLELQVCLVGEQNLPP